MCWRLPCGQTVSMICSTTWMTTLQQAPADTSKCQHNITNMVKVCKELGFAVNPSKVTSPSPVTSFLGIDIDSHKGVAHIDPECLQAIIQELLAFHQAKLATNVM